MNVTRNATTAFAAIVVLVSMITFSPENNPGLFADRASSQYVPVDPAGQPRVVSVIKDVAVDSTSSLNQSRSPAVAPARSTNIADKSEILSPDSGAGTDDGPALPSVSAADLVPDDSFDRPDSPVVGAGLVEAEQAEGSTPPVANAGLDQSVPAGATVALDGSGSSDADGDTLNYNWILTAAPFGSAAILAGSTTAIPSFVTDLTGIYTVDLVVNDGTDFSAPDTATVTVTGSGSGSDNDANVTPVAVNHSTDTARNVPVDLLLVFTDPDGPGPYTFRIVTQPGSGTLTGAGANRTYTPSPAFTGSDSFRWSVSDGQTESNVATMTVSVNSVNIAPVAQNDSVNTTKDVAIGLGLVFTDPDGPGPYTFTIVSPPSSGVLTGTGVNRTYTPNPWFNGTDSFQWSVNDGQYESNAATMTVTINGVNVAPVAQDDTYATFAGTQLTVGLINGVLANDDDTNGDPLTAALITDPLSGSLTLNEDGSFSYTAAGGFSGPVQFTYVAHDGNVASNTAVVSINVASEFNTLNLQPVDGQTNVSVDPTLEIDCSVAPTTAAQYRIATDSAFTDVVYDSGENINDICSHLAFAGLDPMTTYFWQGRIRDDQGVQTPWSSPTSFTTVNATPIFANVFQDGFNGYSGTGDTDIRGSALDPTQVIREWNQGAQAVLRTGRRLPNQQTDEIYRSLLQFDLDGGLTDPDAVLNAYIELTGWHHTRSNHLFHEYNSMYELNKPWGEGAGTQDEDSGTGEVSWSYTARPGEWDIPGAALASDTDPNADRSETALVQMVATNQEGYKTTWSSKNLVEAVKGWINDPTSNYGVLIKADDEASQQTLNQASRENPDITFRPKLVIVSTESLQAPPNVAPLALDQSVSAGVNLPVGLLLDYNDPDGPGPYTFSIVTPPSQGSLTGTGTGANRTYAPDTGFLGSDSFTWRVNDGLDNSNDATVSITVTQTATLLNDDFNRADSPVVGPGWVELESAVAKVSVAANQLFFADASNATNRPLARRAFSTVPSGTLQWDFDFDWARTGLDTNYEVWMQLGDSAMMVDPSGGLTGFTGVGVNLRWGNFNSVDQRLVARQDTTRGGPRALAVVSGPTEVSVTVDLASQTYSVTIGGTEVGSGLNFDNFGIVSKLDTVRFFTNNLDEQSFSGRNIDNLSITAAATVNTPPDAAAGPDQGVLVGETVNLDGSGSTGSSGDSLTYSWTLTTVPVDSTAGLTGSTTAHPSLVADLVGVYEVELVVNDGTNDSAPDTVSITAGEGPITLLDDAFDRDDSLEVAESWVELESAGATVSIAANRLFFDDTSNVLRRPLVGRSFSPVSTGTLQWDFDFDWARTGADTGYELWMQLGDSTLMVNPSNSIDRFAGVGVDLRWGRFGGVDQDLVARQNTTMGGPTALTVISGPTHLSVTVDLASQTYSVAVNGTEVSSGLFFDDPGALKLDTVRFFTNNLNETSFTGRTFDNVVISRE